jgi:hypothetical protein
MKINKRTAKVGNSRKNRKRDATVLKGLQNDIHWRSPRKFGHVRISKDSNLLDLHVL